MNNKLTLLNQAFDAWNQHDLQTYSEIYTPDAVIHGLAPVPLDVPTALMGYEGFFTGFPDIHIEKLDTVSENGQVAVHFRITGTHEGTFLGIPATGQKIDVTGMSILQYKGDLIRERWNILDRMTMMQQLGAIPA
ncbi:MAG: ester cyclase [Anaerolineales bacterium]|nr:ester cyclase [Anaerolineales bacterium]